MRNFRGNKSRGPPKQHGERFQADPVLLRWMRDISKDGIGRRMTPNQLEKFFQSGQRLVTQSAQTQQNVVIELASEGGLARIKELVDLTETVHEGHKLRHFRDALLPFLQTVTHEDVLPSLILENQLGTLYAFLFGPAGRRATGLFKFIADSFQACQNADIPPPTSYSWAATTLTALVMILESNQTAAVNPAFPPIVDKISQSLQATATAMKDTMVEQAVSASLAKIRNFLSYGTDMPSVDMAEKKPQQNPNGQVTFDLRQDGPGTLSSEGPRHDNDHKDFTKIMILPTAEEVHSERAEYLPLKDLSKSHVGGIKAVLDRNFRLLREDTVGQLRDSVRAVMKELRSPTSQQARASPSHPGPQMFKYTKVALSNIHCDERNRLLITAQFDQPAAVGSLNAPHQRMKWWDQSRQLQVDALVCLATSKGHCVFLSVCERRGTPIPSLEPEQGKFVPEEGNLWQHPRRAAVTLQLQNLKGQDLSNTLGRDGRDSTAQQVLVEFPGILLPAFAPTLQALQHMCKHGNIPFSDLIASSVAEDTLDMWPKYATQPGFAYDLEPALQKGKQLTLSHHDRFDVGVLQSASSLDEAQSNALVGALSRAFALVQGPPGTGKSYVTIQAVKILLKCRENARLNPIICVCYTNHALDQFLEHLIADGTKQVIRIGSQSKSEMIEPLNLRHVAMKMDLTKAEKKAIYESRKALKEAGDAVARLTQNLQRAGSTSNVLSYLAEHHREYHDELTVLEDSEGFRVVKGAKKADPINRWLHDRSAPGEEVATRPMPTPPGVSVWGFSRKQRQALHQLWVGAIREYHAERLQNVAEYFEQCQTKLSKYYQEKDLRCLKEAHVIGVTTSGLARQLDLLRRVQPKVLVCEEAGEILEAHTLTGLLPSVQHAILVGDHEQLRPQIQNFDLSLENPRGAKYSLDISLFERLITTPGSSIPYDTLRTQRRMDPSMSRLIRNTIYPDLLDHDSVQSYPAVSGVRQRLYWIDHRQEEAAQDASKLLAMSHSNDHEVSLVQALATHLIRQGVYGSDQIVILTPYVRQLQKIREAMAESVEIVVGERDQEELTKASLKSGGDSLVVPNTSATHRAMLTQTLRIATVDNFQGEEADVIIVSLVRSNLENKCGFLRTTNRINVLLSRARHGMYIIGNKETSRHVRMWADVVEMLEETGNIGPRLPLCCPRHPEIPIEAATPDDFQTLAPEGGCNLRCNLRLACGHACTFKCHSKPRHETVICQEPCPRRRDTCDHECPRKCGEECGPCIVPIKNVVLPCGHVKSQIPCYQKQVIASVQCSQLVEQTMPDCDHVVKVKCGVDVEDAKFRCNAVCKTHLPCGHDCIKKCHECRNKDGEIDHKKCTIRCGRPFSTCAHACTAQCHGQEPCPLCKAPCDSQCPHSHCGKTCQEPCAPCAEYCPAGCIHQGNCTMPCGVPCNIVPCSRRCLEVLECGHQCPSLCGEPCPQSKYCQICADDAVKDAAVDYIEGLTYREINLDNDPIIIPQCGHLLTMTSMDGTLDMASHFETDDESKPVALRTLPKPLSVSGLKGCPMCRRSLQNITRYSTIVKRAFLDESTKKFIVWSNASFVPLTSRLQQLEENLRAKKDILNPQGNNHRGIPTHIGLAGPAATYMQVIRQLPGLSVYDPLFDLRVVISRYLKQVDELEQPYAKVRSMVQNVALKNGHDATFAHNGDVLQTRGRLLAASLFLRCDLVILSSFVNLMQNVQEKSIRTQRWLKLPLTLDLAQSRQDCLDLATEAGEKNQPMIELESRLYFARFGALERTAPADPGAANDVGDKGREQVAIAREILKTTPSTISMSEEVEETAKMLRESTFHNMVTSAEKQQIYNAMAQDFRGTGHWYYCENMHLVSPDRGNCRESS